MKSQQFFDQLAVEFVDLRNENAERKFFSNRTFQSEFKFEPDEHILFLSYQSVKFAIFQTIIPFLIYFALGLGIPFYVLDLNKVYLVIGFVILTVIIGISVIIRVISVTSYRYLITNKRLVIGYTFIQRWARSIDFTNINDIVVQQGILARLFHLGSIFIMTGSNEGINAGGAGSNAKNVILMRGFINIPTPFRVKNLIKRIMNYYEKPGLEIPPLLVPPLNQANIDYPNEMQLFPDEKIFKKYERKRSSSFWGMLMPIILVTFSLVQLAPELFNLILVNPIILIVLLISLGIGIIGIFIISKFHAKAFEYIVTDRRIIMFKKFFSIRLRDVIMGKISEITIFQMAVGRASNFGMLKIGTKGFENLSLFNNLLCIQGIADSSHEKDDIRNIVLHFQRGRMFNPMMEIMDPEYLSN